LKFDQLITSNIKMNNVEHIGIAVKNLAKAEELYTKLLGVQSYKREMVENEGVVTSFFRLGDVKIELLAALHENSPIAKFIEKRGEGIHHIAFGVKDANVTLRKKGALGFTLINEIAKNGADNKQIGFLHPKDTHGVLVEVCSDNS